MRNVASLDANTIAEMAIREYLLAGQRPVASPHLAIAAGILSAHASLDMTVSQVQALRAMGMGHVTSNTLYTSPQAISDAVVRHGGMQPTAQQSQSVLTLWTAPSHMLSWVVTQPASGREWHAWRLRAVMAFSGISYKTASFAALLLWPLASPFVVVDRHVCAMLGHPDYVDKISRKPAQSGKLPSSYRRYRELERAILRQRDKLAPRMNGAQYHWYQWEKQRIAVAGRGGYRGWSHAPLSPYLY